MENSRDQQYAQIEEPAKKSGRVRVHDEQTGAKNVLYPATLHAHDVIYLSLNFYHIFDIQDRVLCF